MGDFVSLELPSVIERFSTGFEGLPEIIEGAASGRMLIARGLLVDAYVVYGLLLDDDTIEIVGVTLDP
ncbi:MAG: hypothetical protein R2716_12265 [Microthrixaceae bacterium]